MSVEQTSFWRYLPIPYPMSARGSHLPNLRYCKVNTLIGIKARKSVRTEGHLKSSAICWGLLWQEHNGKCNGLAIRDQPRRSQTAGTPAPGEIQEGPASLMQEVKRKF